jgi:DNA-binding transcriptional ArsR family regulator
MLATSLALGWKNGGDDCRCLDTLSEQEGDEEVRMVASEALADEDQSRLVLSSRVFKALGDVSRLRLLEFLQSSGRERTGVECVRALGRSQGRVSAHLACLVDCGLVQVRREGRFAFYSVSDPRVPELLALASSLALDHAETVAACPSVAGL